MRVRDLPISIPRDKVSRYLDVKADVSGRSLDSVANELEDRLHSAAFPIEYHAEVLTQTTSSEINLGLVIGAALAVAARDLPADAGRRARLDAGGARLRDAAGRPRGRSGSRP